MMPVCTSELGGLLIMPACPGGHWHGPDNQGRRASTGRHPQVASWGTSMLRFDTGTFNFNEVQRGTMGSESVSETQPSIFNFQSEPQAGSYSLMYRLTVTAMAAVAKPKWRPLTTCSQGALSQPRHARMARNPRLSQEAT